MPHSEASISSRRSSRLLAQELLPRLEAAINKQVQTNSNILAQFRSATNITSDATEEFKATIESGIAEINRLFESFKSLESFTPKPELVRCLDKLNHDCGYIISMLSSCQNKDFVFKSISSVSGSSYRSKSSSALRQKMLDAAANMAAQQEKLKALNKAARMEQEVEELQRQQAAEISKKKLEIEQAKIQGEIAAEQTRHAVYQKALEAEESSEGLMLTEPVNCENQVQESPAAVTQSLVPVDISLPNQKLPPPSMSLSKPAIQQQSITTSAMSLGPPPPTCQPLFSTSGATVQGTATPKPAHQLILPRPTEPLTTLHQPYPMPQPPLFTKTDASNTFEPKPTVETSHCQVPPSPSAYSPTSNPPTMGNEITLLAQALTNSMAMARMPAAEPGVFNGDPLKYNEWCKAFDALIEGKSMSDQERLSYLRRYVSTSVLETIAGFFEYDGESNYVEARKLLESRYGNRIQIMKAFRKRLADWPKVPARNAVELRKFGDALKQCLGAMKSIPELRRMDDYTEVEKLVTKLPDGLIDRWTRIAVKQENDFGYYPSLHKLAEFISEEAQVMLASPTMQKSEPSTSNKTVPPGNRRALKTATSYPTTQYKPKSCLYCKKSSHSIDYCFIFEKKSDHDRKTYAREKNLCFACLKPNHMAVECNGNVKCRKCTAKHASSMHPHTKVQPAAPSTPQAQEAATVGVTVNSIQTNEGPTAMIIPVYVSLRESDQEIMVYALLDTQSDTTFITDSVAEKLKAPYTTTNITISTMTSARKRERCRQYSNLQVRGMDSSHAINLPTTFGTRNIPANNQHIPTRALTEKWAHLLPIRSKIPDRQDCEIGLLIGYDCPSALAPLNSIVGGAEEPFAVETRLGWTVVGGRRSKTTLSGVTNRVEVEVTPAEVIKALEPEVLLKDSNENAMMSQDDIKFISIITNGIKQREDGYYSMPLPFRTPPEIPHSRNMAEKRLRLLSRKLQTDKKLKEEYHDFMNRLIANGDCEVVPDDQVVTTRPNYIPHFGVYHPKKPKLRVVFDCSAKCDRTSLNDHLIQGPDFMNTLLGVLLRFRKDQVAVMCDIEQMFHKFKVDSEHRDYLRFLWFTDKTHDHIQELRMTVHLFGAASSPACATFGLRQVAKDHVDVTNQYSIQASNFIQNDFYVDDGLLSCESPEEAVQVIEAARSICSMANIRLHKIVSNSKQVMEKIPVSERGSTTQNLNLTIDTLPIERALGVEWCLESDSFQFRITLSDKPLTRRGILSTISSVFDPLGFLSPYILIGKTILQQMCRDGADWDDPLSEELHCKWSEWRHGLEELTKIHLPRCVVPPDSGKIITRELHHFSDASTSGYGQCSYLRVVDENGEVHCTLLFGKSRVAPLKAPTIPRAELQAAVLSAKVSNMLTNELKYDEIQHYFWTDSKVVLGYIKNTSKRFHMFVANRVQMIRKTSTPEQWHYTNTKDNPADLASRGLNVTRLINSDWFTGPKFLWKPSLDEELGLCMEFEVSDEDREVKHTHATHQAVTEDCESDVITKYSDWNKAINVVATLLKVSFKIQRQDVPNMTALREEATRRIISLTQKQQYGKEIKELAKGNKLTKHSSILKLHPYIDSEGLLRVGGRLNLSTYSEDQKNPIIIPSKTHIAALIIRYYHIKNGHAGKTMTMNAIRNAGYWITQLSSSVSSYITKCVPCIRLRGVTMEQRMADLPQSRVEESPPFTAVGCDCFGPFTITEGRKQLKKYGVLFTCLASRAIHVELADDLSTDAFINAFRCLVALRGPVKSIHCDQGTNFVGARNELKRTLGEIEEPLRSYLERQGCLFVFNTPSASHMGGVWERQIRTVRSILDGILINTGQRLDTSGLRTLFYEVTSIVNDRPLTVENINDPAEPIPITPNQLLTQKTGATLPPPGSFSDPDIYGRKRWRRVQALAQTFWKRWRLEYLNSLQPRQKWTDETPAIEVGDIVIVKDDNVVRNKWRMGRVERTIASADQLTRKVELLVAGENPSQQSMCRISRPINKLKLLLKCKSHGDLQGGV